jgi:hypothetical protein
MKRVAYKAARGGRTTRSSGSRKADEQSYIMSEGFARFAKQMWPELTTEEARKRALFFADFSYMPEKDQDIDALRKRHEEARAKEEERRKNPPPAPEYKHHTYHETQAIQSHGHSCNGHHCYHTYPGQYGGSRSDTYDPTLCCHCGASAPNPWENERR